MKRFLSDNVHCGVEYVYKVLTPQLYEHTVVYCLQHSNQTKGRRLNLFGNFNVEGFFFTNFQQQNWSFLSLSHCPN